MKTVCAAGIAILLAWAGPVAAEDLASAIGSGKVSARFCGNGASSGDAIAVVVEKTARAGNGTLTLTVPPGTRLESGTASAQNMVVAGVRGRAVGTDSYEPVSTIEVSDRGSSTYILEGYCMNFDKDNPATDTSFSLSSPDPVLASILREAGGLSTAAKQAAVWIHTDHAAYPKVNEKFPVTTDEWAAAEAAIRKARSHSSE